jgi:hypothetical protein
MPRAQDVPPDQRAAITENARRNSRFTYAERRIRQIVDAAPKLTPAQRDQLALLLRSGGDHDDAAA